MSEYRIGDPVVDLAQGRPMVVLGAPTDTVAEWSDRNGYDLMDNYANRKFDPDADEGIVECVYVSDVRSEPSKTYTFPVSRVALIDVHHADGGRRVADRIISELLSELFMAASADTTRRTLREVAIQAGVSEGVVEEARELAELGQHAATDD
jgi:hypothetical protein